MINFFEYYKTKGHVFGECMSKSDTDLMYIHIPKNASSWTKPNLQDWKWEFYNYHTDNLYHKHAIIVLRDPIERWLSGIAEYFYLRHRCYQDDYITPGMFDLIFDRVAFDDHTEKQILFIENLNLNNSTFFYCDSGYREKFSKFLESYGMPNRYTFYEYQYQTIDNAFKTKWKRIFTNIINEIPEYQKKLEWYFAADYRLIQSVKFYEG